MGIEGSMRFSFPIFLKGLKFYSRLIREHGLGIRLVPLLKKDSCLLYIFTYAKAKTHVHQWDTISQ